MAKNQIKTGVILSYILIFFKLGIGLIYVPVMIRLLGQSEYGLYTLVGSVVSYLSLFSLGFTGAYLRFYSRYKIKGDEEEIARLNGMFINLFMCMSAAAFICGMILSGFTDEIFGTKLTLQELKRAKVLMQILVVNLALTFPSSIFDSIISANEKFIFQRIVAMLGIIFNPMICLPLLLMGYKSIAVVMVTTIITILKLIVNIVYCKYKLHTKFIFGEFDKSLIKEIAEFSFFIFLNMIIDQINWSVDKFILGRVRGTSAVAIYGVGAMINTLYITFSSAVSSVFCPKINMIANGENREHKFTELFVKVGRIQWIVLGLIMSGFIIFGKFFIVDIYASPEYVDAYYVALFLIIPITVPLIQNLGLEIQRSVNKHKFRSKVYFVMSIANIFISIPLSKAFGAIGASIGTAVSLIVANGIIMNIYYNREIGINIKRFWNSIFNLSKGMIVPCMMGVILIVCVEFTRRSTYIIWIMIYMIVYCISMYKWGMNAYEKKIVKSIFNKAKCRRR